MKRAFLALTVALLLLLVVGVGTAAANPPASQGSGQWAGNGQDAGAAAGTAQQGPSNQNDPLRVLSHGDDGEVSQSNEASSEATAVNANATDQNADQLQGCEAPKVRGPADQCYQPYPMPGSREPECDAPDVKGPDGGCYQPYSVPGPQHGSEPGPYANQACGGPGVITPDERCGPASSDSGSQVIGQSAQNDQDATALSETVQEEPSNSNVSVRVLSEGDNGDVSQSNDASSEATAANLNLTEQDADQTQAGGSGLQAVGQSAKNEQDATALSKTVQEKPSNSNVSVRVLSPGDDGDVWQSNDASSNATAANLNLTKQTADQTQGGDSCKCGGGIQAIGQLADSEQNAAAIAATIQEKPSNSNAPVRVLSKGDDGDVWQSNDASSNATAANLNLTKQDAEQTQAGSAGIQAIGQSAKSEQGAFALGLTIQKGASNENAPLRVLSKGDTGDVWQSNKASSNATAANLNLTKQVADQTQGGHSCKCGGGIQAIGQSSKNTQGAVALAATLQLGIEQPCKCKDDSQIGNSNAPTRVLSPGDDGAVRQSNVAKSDAKAVNWNATKQAASQIQGHPCRCHKDGDGLQLIGQKDVSSQFAVALAASLQLNPSNKSTPDRKKSPGKSGPVGQKEMKAAEDAAGSSTESDRSKKQVERG